MYKYILIVALVSSLGYVNSSSDFNGEEQLLEKLGNINMKTVVNFISERLSNVTDATNCSTALAQYAEDLIAVYNGDITKFYALQVFDAMGKLPSGVMIGDLGDKVINMLGEEGECVEIESDEFKGRWGIIIFPPSQTPIGPLTVVLGVCVPSICSTEDLNLFLGNSSDPPSPKVLYLQSDYNIKDDTPAIIALSVVSIILFMVFVGTMTDLSLTAVEYIQTAQDDFKSTMKVNLNTILKASPIEGSVPVPVPQRIKPQKKILPLEILLCFSLYKNTKKLFTIKKGGEGQMDCLNGIRFLSMSWVLTGHCFVFWGAEIKYVKNRDQTFQKWGLKDFTFLSVTNGGPFSVDSFFLLSGLLTAYLFMKEAKKLKKVQLYGPLMIKFYVHRILRLTPPYMLTLMFVTWLSGPIVSGRYYDKKQGLNPNCRTNWWTNLLYINNLVNTDKMCMGVSWYLGNDMQFHWLSPLMLIPLALGTRKEKYFRYFTFLGLGILFMIMLIHNIVTFFVISDLDKAEYGSFSALHGEVNGDVFRDVYIKPWTRIGPFLIGIFYGFAINEVQANPGLKYLFKKTSFLTPFNLIGWISSLSIMGFLIFGIWKSGILFQGDPWPYESLVFYEGSKRNLWALSLGFMIFSCVLGKGGFINDILSWTVWIPLARLSFAAYLIHDFCIYWYLTNMQHRPFFQVFTYIYMCVGTMFITFIAAYCISMVFEVPFSNVEKVIEDHIMGTRNHGGSSKAQIAQTLPSNTIYPKAVLPSTSDGFKEKGDGLMLDEMTEEDKYFKKMAESGELYMQSF